MDPVRSLEFYPHPSLPPLSRSSPAYSTLDVSFGSLKSFSTCTFPSFDGLLLGLSGSRFIRSERTQIKTGNRGGAVPWSPWSGLPAGLRTTPGAASQRVYNSPYQWLCLSPEIQRPALEFFHWGFL